VTCMPELSESETPLRPFDEGRTRDSFEDAGNRIEVEGVSKVVVPEKNCHLFDCSFSKDVRLTKSHHAVNGLGSILLSKTTSTNQSGSSSKAVSSKYDFFPICGEPTKLLANVPPQ